MNVEKFQKNAVGHMLKHYRKWKDNAEECICIPRHGESNCYCLTK